MVSEVGLRCHVNKKCFDLPHYDDVRTIVPKLLQTSVYATVLSDKSLWALKPGASYNRLFTV